MSRAPFAIISEDLVFAAKIFGIAVGETSWSGTRAYTGDNPHGPTLRKMQWIRDYVMTEHRSGPFLTTLEWEELAKSFLQNPTAEALFLEDPVEYLEASLECTRR